MQLYLVDGARLRELREQTGLSQVELSLMIGQSDTWAEEMERESRVHVLEIIVQKLTSPLPHFRLFSKSRAWTWRSYAP
jgi:transcriptional regulator with XRE-family HTH domain